MVNKKTPATVKPGQKVQDSGIYKESKTGVKATMVKGEPAPPTPKKGAKWEELVSTNPTKRGK